MKKFNKEKYLRKLRLRSFYRKYGKYFYIGITCLLVAVIGIYFAFSKYSITTEETVINMKVGNFVRGDIVLIPYVEEQYSKSFPKKGEGYTVNNILCNNDVKAEWDVNNWELFAGDLTKKTKCSIYFTKSKTYEFQFASKEETFKAPVSGIYRLEAWGASGGGEGGVGSYSTGKVYLDKDEILYINVGGTADGNKGGYNGGGNGANGGGGATHIAKSSGLLSTLSADNGSILIVAGGGGGSGVSGNGGNAGGMNGLKGADGPCTKKYGNGGTQTAGGTAVDSSWASSGTFGQGGNYKVGSSDSEASGGAGGGGYYGGASGTSGSCYGGGGGGSGYIGNNLLTEKAMYCRNCAESSTISTKTINIDCSSSTPTENCSKIGDGYVKITLIGENSLQYDFDYTGRVQIFNAPASGIYKLETWGASGGDGGGWVGGTGGYSRGNIYLNAGEPLYLSVGGRGADYSSTANGDVTPKGGWNGGGNGGRGYDYTNKKYPSGSAGGGATSIQNVLISKGTLSSYSNSKNNVLIVSGGGGGIAIHSGSAGNGGGASGTKSTAGKSGGNANPGTQTSGYAFGNGQSANDKSAYGSLGAEGNGGGGGGYYGGYANNTTGNGSDDGGGGGSGYIGNSLLSDKVMYCHYCTENTAENTKTITTTCASSTPTEECTKRGNGFIRISLIAFEKR